MDDPVLSARMMYGDLNPDAKAVKLSPLGFEILAAALNTATYEANHSNPPQTADAKTYDDVQAEIVRQMT